MNVCLVVGTVLCIVTVCGMKGRHDSQMTGTGMIGEVEGARDVTSVGVSSWESSQAPCVSLILKDPSVALEL